MFVTELLQNSWTSVLKFEFFRYGFCSKLFFIHLNGKTTLARLDNKPIKCQNYHPFCCVPNAGSLRNKNLLLLNNGISTKTTKVQIVNKELQPEYLLLSSHLFRITTILQIKYRIPSLLVLAWKGKLGPSRPQLV